MEEEGLKKAGYLFTYYFIYFYLPLFWKKKSLSGSEAPNWNPGTR